jgi:uncharacterized protein YprB with RNaseH-like and TPR domain
MADVYERLKRFQQNNSGSVTGSAPPELPSAQTPASAHSPASKIEKLSHLPGVVRGRDLLGAAQKREEKKHHFLNSIGVMESANETGTYGVKDVVYPVDQMSCCAEEISGMEMYRQCHDERMAGLDGSRLLFIDTETTGLAGGTGTVPFMIGVGYFENQSFVVRQFFMRDYDDEPAILQEVHELLQRFDGVCTYNGKCFDVPLLHSRFLLNRQRTRIADLPHFDLLYSARRFWRELLPNCQLSTVEASIFGHRRVQDVPSEMIPYIYFDYLRGIRMSRIKPVFAHNAEDIRTLAMIAARACRMMRNPLQECQHAHELIGMARYCLAEEDEEQAAEFLYQAMQSRELEPALEFSVCKQLSMIHKRCGEYAKAVPLWQRMIERHADCFPFIELAKYFEHRERQFEQALHFTEQVLEGLQNGMIPSKGMNLNMILQELNHRRRRLLQKMG